MTRPSATVRAAQHGANDRQHPLARVMAFIVAGVLGFGLVYGQTTVAQIESALTVRDVSDLLPTFEVPDIPEDPTDPDAGRAINILIIGSDIRDAENGVIGGEVEGMRADATMLMHVSADRSRIEFVSFPRDLRVAVPDCQLFDGTTVRGWTGKFNIAFANGGRNDDEAEAAACAMRTVTELTGVPVRNFVVLDFAGFRDVIDTLGGVPMCVPHDMRSSKAKLNVSAGPQVFDGATALAWARARTGTGLGDGTDLARIERQQQLLENTVRKVLGMNLFTDVGALTQFLRATAESLTMDTEIGSVSYFVGLAFSLRNVDTDRIEFVTVPWRYPGDGTTDVVMADEAPALFARLAADQPLTAADGEGATTMTSVTERAGSATSPAPPDASPQRETEQDILDACA